MTTTFLFVGALVLLVGFVLGTRFAELSLRQRERRLAQQRCALREATAGARAQARRDAEHSSVHRVHDGGPEDELGEMRKHANPSGDPHHARARDGESGALCCIPAVPSVT